MKVVAALLLGFSLLLGWWSVLTLDGALVGTRPFVSADISGGPFPKTIRTPSGEELSLPEPPERIISLTLGSDEILTAIAPPERIVGLTRWAPYPSMSSCMDRIPEGVQFMDSNPERVLALNPDLVVVGAFSHEPSLRLLIGAGVPILKLGGSAGIGNVRHHIALLGAVTGAEGKAAELIASIDKRLERVRQRIAGRTPPRVLYYSTAGHTFGAGTTVDEAIRLAGGRNLATEAGVEGVRKIPLELVLTLNPDVIVLPLHSEQEEPAYASEIFSSPLWRNVTAVRTGRVYYIRSAWMTNLSQHLVDGIEALAATLHPEAPEA